MFYTRFPVREVKGWSENMLNKSTRYFPLIGVLVGAVTAFSFFAASRVFPVSLALILAMAVSVLFTGAFHEDGFADFCDGFGGGHTKERILEIMKDSRIGTYGTIGLLLMFGTKYASLVQVEEARIPFILIAGNAFSRIFPVLLIYTANYARLDATSKTKPVGKADSVFSLIFALATGNLLLVFLHWQEIVFVIILLTVVFLLFRMYIIKRLGGYTGDVLGALQQITEVLYYLVIAAKIQ
jgi:adenosylcobinamide-GDP ribazoletransferase